MIIGFDAKRIVRNGTGLGSYGRTLVNDLIRRGDTDMEYLLYAPDKGRDDLRQQIIEGAQFRYPSFNSLQAKRLATITSILQSFNSPLWRTYGIVNDLRRDGIQLYHGLSGELPIGIRKSGIRSVVTIHDLIFLRHPEYYHWIDTKLYAWKFHQTIKEADRIIAISERTKQDIMEYGHISDERIRLVYQSYAPRFSTAVTPDQQQEVRQRYLLPERFILNVGTIERRKNLRLAVDALSLLPSDIHLVAVGRQTKYAQTLPQSNRLHLLSGVPDADLAVIYSLAEAFVYPSRYEGFGIPIIEAIAAGLPVVACTGSCLEEAGGPSCLYVDPDDVEGMAAALLSVLEGADGRDERIRLSQQYIERFRGTDVAGQVLAVYRELF
ncbi:MAG: glycosyltransferase family 4 protein [Prevotella sp.]|nr:glycosyltransferase family 4 protein [Prevotella sp.]